jgi:hypothetical protein|tara:strand:+ start:94 stop:378 length:285 start_codon:yes stop_codon:yes gene_type:complete
LDTTNVVDSYKKTKRTVNSEESEEDTPVSQGGFFTSPLFLATLLAFAVYYGLPEAWRALPEVDPVNKAYDEVIEYIDQYVPTPTNKVNNTQKTP